ncbi:MAG TPA: prepilin-type N-terminal cleavage/methylation domain-containing protein [Phycisphaerae bacterium]|nr:prepilin-type N-terminal cleavage/methylation domain-containing protein [Phycisphaerae bacterium]HRW55473.1 prepilin-type N-terminal cleavage/methylation domain-containing protein [Phycisphaerae bacterium]
MPRLTEIRRPRRGFTLIELLVVIAILAILISILLPSLSAARRRTRQTVCQTRLRELSNGWHMYADDNDEMCVPGRMANLGGGSGNPQNWYDIGSGMKYRPRWVATMGKYVGTPALQLPRTDVDRQDYDHAVYACTERPEWIDERNYAFGYNHQFLGNSRRTNGRFHNFPVNRSRIASFGGTVLAADCMGTAAGVATSARLAYENDGGAFESMGNHGWTLDPPRLIPTGDIGTGDAGSPRTAVDPRHVDKANVVYADGHGESQKPEQLGYEIGPDGEYLQTGPNARNYLWSGSGRDEDPPEKP